MAFKELVQKIYFTDGNISLAVSPVNRLPVTDETTHISLTEIKTVLDSIDSKSGTGGGGGGTTDTTQIELKLDELKLTNSNILSELQTQQKDAITDAQLRASPVTVDTQLQQGLTDAELRASDVQVNDNVAHTILNDIKSSQLPDNHQVSVSNFPTEQTISGTVNLSTQTLLELEDINVTVSNQLQQGLTDTQLRASDIQVNDDISQGLLADIRNSQLPDNHQVEVSNQVLQPLTDAQLRAIAVVVDTQLQQGLTDAELRASDVSVADDLTQAEYLTDQVSDGNVLTFTFSSVVHQIWVEFKALGSITTAKFTVGQENTPAVDLGTPLSDQTPYPVTVVTDTVKVLAPAGSTVTVYGYRR